MSDKEVASIPEATFPLPVVTAVEKKDLPPYIQTDQRERLKALFKT